MKISYRVTIIINRIGSRKIEGIVLLFIIKNLFEPVQDKFDRIL
jgi:hypothetical protein